ncbi:hypothetical protein BDY17DRAFT_340919 [Neohortaea acidophila]|uniref:Shugoshin n=1 Tax=Neohortaea acidophila TaxID=245834 RepID=A0A6A6PL22_9PEZI|nr:uncharacterized protein BDY17DRAFT_340919 [Neohortaea acidophila]KAF2479967.1 hypothetical protein BDY17DRAFT_340919 [Neohortaea acidophila]
MARLNEPPAAPAASLYVAQPGTESIDTLKRRFIRQNRDLAKSNSFQALRIRNLEIDVTRLLDENLELRNQVLRLEHDVYNAQTHVQKVKRELQAKFVEFFSGLSSTIEEDDPILPDSMTTGRRPIEGKWRERQPLSEVMRDSQMPTIMEHKQYPRRTLDAGEIHAARLSDQSNNESPDLGPPPVARFDSTDTVKNASPLLNKTTSEMPATQDDDELPPNLSINLETRRKRKDGQPKLEIRRHSILPQSPSRNENETSAILRTGAKRKLADRETEKPIKPPSQGDFTFSRRVNTDENRSALLEKAQGEGEALDSAPMSPNKPIRKVLGDKSVNMSPRKRALQSEESSKGDPENRPPLDAGSGKDTVPTRRRKAPAIPVLTPQNEVVQTVEIAPASTDMPPQTPAEPDLFSPTPSEPSTLPAAGRGDTPPPGDLSTLSTTSDGAGRPSRRARSAVNYAEPSLIAKMRRPDKKMMDAVTGLQDPRRAMSISGDRRSSSQPATTIKKEPQDPADLWKLSLPAADLIATSSPLTQKSGGEELLGSPDTNSTTIAAPLHPPKPSTSSANISALMAASRKRRESSHLPQRPLGTDMDVAVATKKMEDLDVYDFKESSSPLDGGLAPRPRAKVAHRRHSSVPKDAGLLVSGTGSGATIKVDSGSGEVGRVARTGTAGRRRSMMV